MLPISLDQVATVLDLSVQKDKTGKKLITQFCTPAKPTLLNGTSTRNPPLSDPTGWAAFVEYNRRDVEVEKAIWRCGHKYDGDTKCSTGHIGNDRLEHIFLDAIRQRFTTRTSPLLEQHILKALDASSLELEAAGLVAQIEQVAKHLETLIARNARIVLDQDAYEKSFTAAHRQHEELLTKHAEVLAEIQDKHNRMAAYRYYKQQIAELDVDRLTFSPYHCVTLLDHATVHTNGTITFTFRDGSNVKVEIEAQR